MGADHGQPEKGAGGPPRHYYYSHAQALQQQGQGPLHDTAPQSLYAAAATTAAAVAGPLLLGGGGGIAGPWGRRSAVGSIMGGAAAAAAAAAAPSSSGGGDLPPNSSPVESHLGGSSFKAWLPDADAALFSRYAALAQSAGMLPPPPPPAVHTATAGTAAAASGNARHGGGGAGGKVNLVTDGVQIDLFRRSVMSGVSAPGDDPGACARWTVDWGVAATAGGGDRGDQAAPPASSRAWLASAFTRAALEAGVPDRAAQYVAYAGGWDLLDAPVGDVPVVLLGGGGGSGGGVPLMVG